MQVPYPNYTTVDDIKKYGDILQIINEVVPLQRKGNRYWARCPFHGEKTASFSVDPEKQRFYCFGCHAGGDVIDFVAQNYQLSFLEAKDWLAERYGLHATRDGPGRKAIQQVIAEREYLRALETAAGAIINEEFQRLCILEKAAFRILDTIKNESDLNRSEVIAALQTKDRISYYIDSLLQGNETERLKLAITLREVEF